MHRSAYSPVTGARLFSPGAAASRPAYPSASSPRSPSWKYQNKYGPTVSPGIQQSFLGKGETYAHPETLEELESFSNDKICAWLRHIDPWFRISSNLKPFRDLNVDGEDLVHHLEESEYREHLKLNDHNALTRLLDELHSLRFPGTARSTYQQHEKPWGRANKGGASSFSPKPWKDEKAWRVSSPYSNKTKADLPTEDEVLRWRPAQVQRYLRDLNRYFELSKNMRPWIDHACDGQDLIEVTEREDILLDHFSVREKTIREFLVAHFDLIRDNDRSRSYGRKDYEGTSRGYSGSKSPYSKNRHDDLRLTIKIADTYNDRDYETLQIDCNDSMTFGDLVERVEDIYKHQASRQGHLKYERIHIDHFVADYKLDNFPRGKEFPAHDRLSQYHLRDQDVLWGIHSDNFGPQNESHLMDGGRLRDGRAMPGVDESFKSEELHLFPPPAKDKPAILVDMKVTSDGKVRVRLCRAANLHAMDYTGKSDPYCVLSIEPDSRDRSSRKMSRTVKQNLYPEWYEEFTWQVNGVARRGPDAKKLVIECWDFDRTTDDDFLGHFEQPLFEVLEKQSSEYKNWFQIYRNDAYGNKKRSKYGEGHYNNSSRRHSDETDYYDDYRRGSRNDSRYDGPRSQYDGPRGRYDGSSSMHDDRPRSQAHPRPSPGRRDNHIREDYGVPKALDTACLFLDAAIDGSKSDSRKTLTITVKAGRHLPAHDSNGLSDPYVLLRLIPKPRSGQTVVKTDVQPKTLHPDWTVNNRFTFELGASHFDTHEHARIEVECWDKDKFSKDDFCGGCVILVKDIYRSRDRRLNEWFPIIESADWNDPDKSQYVGHSSYDESGYITHYTDHHSYDHVDDRGKNIRD